MAQPIISVIIPTLAEKAREYQIKRCIESVRKASVNKVKIIVVVNGNRHDEEVCQWLRAQNDIRYEYLEKGSVPLALIHGRSLVDTPFFSTIDDDDEHLEGSADIKLAVLMDSPEADLVVTNGYFHLQEGDVLFYSNMDKVPEQPFTSLFVENWLNSGNALYRSSAVGKTFFENYYTYAEWTWLAFQLAMAGKKVATTNAPCFRIHVTPGSLSKTEDYKGYGIELSRRMLAENPPSEIKQLIRKRIGACYHAEANKNLIEGQQLKAIKNHILSLCYSGASRYLLFSRKMIPGWPR